MKKCTLSSMSLLFLLLNYSKIYADYLNNQLINPVILSDNIGNIFNYGTISGTGNTITALNFSDFNNYGSIISSNIALSGAKGRRLTNVGVMTGTSISNLRVSNEGVQVILDSSGNLSQIQVYDPGGFNFNGGFIILNGLSYNSFGIFTSSTTSAVDNYSIASEIFDDPDIINGAGINQGALVVDENYTISNGAINGYNIAVSFKDPLRGSDSLTFTANNTILNGGGINKDIPVVQGDDNNNIVTFLGTSIINGGVALGDGDDTINFANTAVIFGSLDGGDGMDTLNFTKGNDTTTLNFNQNISNFETINIEGNTSFSSTMSVTGNSQINLNGGDLTLEIDSNNILNEEYIGHALYNNSGIIQGGENGGNLILGVQDLVPIFNSGNEIIIDMGAFLIDTDLDAPWFEAEDSVITNSILLDSQVIENGEKVLIEIKGFDDLVTTLPEDSLVGSIPDITPPETTTPENPPPVTSPDEEQAENNLNILVYEKLNDIFTSILTADQLQSLIKTTTFASSETYLDSLGALLSSLEQIYSNNPYAYTLKSSRDTLKLFGDDISYYTIKPKEDELLILGNAVFSGIKSDTVNEGQNFYGFDSGSSRYKTTTNLYGAYSNLEYGLTNSSSLGLVLGGANQKTTFTGSSNIKGNSFFSGLFLKTQFKNLKFFTGINYLYSSIEADRVVTNLFDTFASGDDYNLNGINPFVEIKYLYEITSNIAIEPKIKIDYYKVSQKSISEEFNPLSVNIDVDSISSHTTDIGVGFDIIKKSYTYNALLKNILAFEVITTEGDTKKDLLGKVIGENSSGSSFEIEGTKLPKTSGKVSYNIEVEKNNNFIYSAGISYEFSDSYDENLNVSLNIGYKF